MIIVNVRTGSLFVCIKGYTVDGHDFAKSAVEQWRGCCLGRTSIRLECSSYCCPRYNEGDGGLSRCVLWSSNSKVTIDWHYWNKW